MKSWLGCLTMSAVVAVAPAGEAVERVFVEGPRMAAPLVAAPDRVDLEISLAPAASGMQAYFDQGLTQFYGGWLSEAARSFQTILIEDPDCPMAYWGLAQANVEWPTRAAWFARAAWLKRGLAMPAEQGLIDVLAKFHGVAGPDEPPGLEEPWNLAPGEEPGPPLLLSDQEPYSDAAVVGLIVDYADLLGDGRGSVEVRALYVEHLVRTRGQERVLNERIAELQPGAVEAQCQLVFRTLPMHPLHAVRMRHWLQESEPVRALDSAKAIGAVSPSVGAGWFAAAAVFRGTGQPLEALVHYEKGEAAVFDHCRRTWQEPTSWGAPGEFLVGDGLRAAVIAGAPKAELPVDVRWDPIQAPEWKLPDAYGNEIALADYRGQPLLVVNFLGFGCVHCLEQLQAIKPLAKDFHSAGIAIVAVGLQTPKDLRGSLGEDPAQTGYPFPILCDPGLGQFRAYGAYDDFAGTELHGTYLLDGEGRVRWIDISHLPFMDISGLLKDSQRLLGDVPQLR